MTVPEISSIFIKKVRLVHNSAHMSSSTYSFVGSALGLARSGSVVQPASYDSCFDLIFGSISEVGL